MSSPSHPLWGRSTGSYKVPSDMERVNLSLDAERAGLLALQKITRVSTGAPARNQVNSSEEISISTLETALSLARDPRTIRHLAKLPAICSYIHLMRTITTGTTRVVSPFSYEYGHLCLKLLVYTLNACLVERWNKTKETLVICNRHPDAAAHRAFAIMSAKEVDNQFDILKAGGDCDWVLGWSTSPRHPRQTPLISRSDASALLSLLWDDRKQLLLALMPYTPTSSGLSSLLFVLTRFIDRERHPHHNHDWETLRYLLYELALRYMLVADKHQREATLRVVDANKIVDTWQAHPKHVDPQDSRCILTAFIHIISGENKDILMTRDPYIMLRFIPLATDAETQDLLPEVIRLTIVYGWAMLTGLDDEDEIEMFIQCFIGCLHSLIRPPHNRPYPLTPITQAQIIDAMHDSDFLDLIARAIIRLKPGESRSHAELNISILGGLGYFLNSLVKAVPEIELGQRFKGYVPSWWKVNQHLLITEFGMPAVLSIPYRNHYEQCVDTWLELAEILGLRSVIDDHVSVNCCSGRCPMAHSTISRGARFACTGCMRTMYCDALCQAMDWKFGGINPPHQESPICGANYSHAFRQK